ncbi:hypothetical protein MKX01_016340 [Papaver californicum]|nr:hypothetical protein MKX01_016340 [Papaver californicum]
MSNLRRAPFHFVLCSSLNLWSPRVPNTRLLTSSRFSSTPPVAVQQHILQRQEFKKYTTTAPAADQLIPPQRQTSRHFNFPTMYASSLESGPASIQSPTISATVHQQSAGPSNAVEQATHIQIHPMKQEQSQAL